MRFIGRGVEGLARMASMIVVDLGLQARARLQLFAQARREIGDETRQARPELMRADASAGQNFEAQEVIEIFRDAQPVDLFRHCPLVLSHRTRPTGGEARA